MTDLSGGMHDIEVCIHKRRYVISTDAGSEETVRNHASALDRSAVMLVEELGHVPEKLLLLLSAIQALEEVESERTLEQEAAAEATETMFDASRRIQDLVTRLER